MIKFATFPDFWGPQSNDGSRYYKIPWACSLDYKSLLNFTCLTMILHNHVYSNQQCNLLRYRVAQYLIWKLLSMHVCTAWGKQSYVIIFNVCHGHPKTDICFKNRPIGSLLWAWLYVQQGTMILTLFAFYEVF